MKLTKLFKMQRELDERIVREKGLNGQDLLPNKVLALQVELGELANEWQMFKYWKENPQPIIASLRNPGMIPECPEWYNPLLEEYVDCLHFALSIGIETGNDDLTFVMPNTNSDIIYTFIELNAIAADLLDRHLTGTLVDTDILYIDLLEKLFGLGKQLGFTLDQIEAEYLRKNAINHHRQECGY
jgi:dimeric dUTPase (all-alpha-NTP-PPase superfamily)